MSLFAQLRRILAQTRNDHVVVVNEDEAYVVMPLEAYMELQYPHHQATREKPRARVESTMSAQGVDSELFDSVSVGMENGGGGVVNEDLYSLREHHINPIKPADLPGESEIRYEEVPQTPEPAHYPE